MHDAYTILTALYAAYSALPLAPYINSLAGILLAANALLSYLSPSRY
jgi:hypothetical protein